MKEKFEDRTLTGAFSVKCKNEDGTFRVWQGRKEEVVSQIVSIMRRYAAMGYRLTLRQLHYQLVTKNWIVNHDTAYKKLGDILDDCRYAGIVDWDAIEDRGRVPHRLYHADSVPEAIEDLHAYYRRNRQQGQKNVVEVWTEKDALSGILKGPAEKYHVHLVVNKGYTSSSALYRAYLRILEAIEENKTFTILYFGDHDPSGLDMVRDITDRLTKFISQGTQLRDCMPFRAAMQREWDIEKLTIHHLFEGDYISLKACNALLSGTGDADDDIAFDTAQIRRYIEMNGIFRVIAIGLTKDQIKQYNLPPNPTKLTDSRAASYIAQHGRTCWEVDALDPEVLDELVASHIRNEISIQVYDKMLAAEERDKKKIKTFIKK